VLPLLQYKDMPSFLINYEKDPSFLDLAVGQFSNIHQADWILCNSFYELDEEVISLTKSSNYLYTPFVFRVSLEYVQ
jgi:hypothetical protein